MKTLILDPTQPKARELANCLIGSPCALDDKSKTESHVLGVKGEMFLVDFKWDNFEVHCWDEKLFLPIDSLEVCPWMCSKYRIPIFLKEWFGDSVANNDMLTELLVKVVPIFHPFKVEIDLKSIKDWEGVQVVE